MGVDVTKMNVDDQKKLFFKKWNFFEKQFISHFLN